MAQRCKSSIALIVTCSATPFDYISVPHNSCGVPPKFGYTHHTPTPTTVPKIVQFDFDAWAFPTSGSDVAATCGSGVWSYIAYTRTYGFFATSLAVLRLADRMVHGSASVRWPLVPSRTRFENGGDFGWQSVNVWKITNAWSDWSVGAVPYRSDHWTTKK